MAHSHTFVKQPDKHNSNIQLRTRAGFSGTPAPDYPAFKEAFLTVDSVQPLSLPQTYGPSTPAIHPDNSLI
jgi:hypothetical protein